MELPEGMGRQLIWGLLALQQRLVSRSALLTALDSWHNRPEQPLSRIVLEQQTLDADQTARLDTAIQDILDRHDSDPVKMFHVIALGEALEGVLEEVSDSVWLSRLRLAAKAVGVEETGASSLTQSSAAGDPQPSSATDEADQGDCTVGLAALSPAANPPYPVAPRYPGTPVKMRDTGGQIEDSEGRAGGSSDTELWAGGVAADSQTTSPPGEDGNGSAQPPLAGMGTVQSRYRILRPHAEGGLGAVFVAHDEELHREVALKEILERHGQSTEYRLRFLLEAEVTGGLEHPGIVPVYGLGQYEDGRPYYAMRFIRGESFKSAIAHFHMADKPDRDPGERAVPAPVAHPFRGRLRGDCLRPQPRRAASGSQAGQCDARQVRRNPGRRLGPGQASGSLLSGR